jgi:hypothetical protein
MTIDDAIPATTSTIEWIIMLCRKEITQVIVLVRHPECGSLSQEQDRGQVNNTREPSGLCNKRSVNPG